MNLNMQNVGHGLNVYINETLMLDCGSHNLKKFISKFNNATLNTKVETFVLSHLHYDHYNGISDTSKFPNLTKFYIPGIPNVSSDPDIIINFYVLLLTIGSLLNNKILLVDLFQKLTKSGNKVTCQFLYNDLKGINLNLGSTSQFNIIWPPKNLDPDSTLIKRIDSVLNKFNDLKLPIYGFNDLRGIFRDILNELINNNGNLTLTHNYDKSWEEVFKKFNALEISDKKTIERYDYILKKLADDLSIAFTMYTSEGQELLFLGDLRGARIKNALDEIPISGSRFKTNILLPPHHGTRWHNDMNKICSIYCLSSLSKSDIDNKYYKKAELQMITHNLMDTYSTNNDINILI